MFIFGNIGLFLSSSETKRSYKTRTIMKDEVLEPLTQNITEDIRKANNSGDHSEILKIIKDRNLTLISEVNGKSLMKTLLDEIVNGHKIVGAILDDCVSATCEREDSLQFAIQMDWSGLDRVFNGSQESLLFEILKLRAKHFGPFSKLFRHPVIAAFIALKWRKSKKYFYIQSGIFVAFLLLYSFFLVYLFNRPDGRCTQISAASTTSPMCEDETYNRTVNTFLDFSQPLEMFVYEILLLLLTLILALIEVYQAIKLGSHYYTEIENYFEWFVLISAFISMGFKDVILQEASDIPKSSFVRGFTSLGICFAWLVLIFVIGRYPFNGGDFSIMFMVIIKKLCKYMIAMFCMILGFAFAFMVVNYGYDIKSFDSPFKRIVQTLTMALGMSSK